MDLLADIFQKLEILADAAKYDVACTSSGVDRKGTGKGMGNSIAPGICHTFSADGRCVSLLKILFTRIFRLIYRFIRGGTTYDVLGNSCDKSRGLLTFVISYRFFASGEEALISILNQYCQRDS